MKVKFRSALAVILAFSMLSVVGCQQQVSKNDSDVGSSNSASNSTSEQSAGDSTVSSGTQSGQSSSANGSSGISSVLSNSNVTSGSAANIISSGTTGKTSSANNTGKTNIVVWDSETNTALTLATVDYAAKNKNINITIQQKGKTTLTALKMAISANSAPDIVCMDQVYLTASGNLGYLKDLTKYGASSVKSKFLTSCINSATYKSAVYGLPFDANTIAFAYNKDILNGAGATVPTTYSQLITACQKVAAKYGSAKYAYTVAFDGWSDKNWMAFNYFFWLWRMGGDILSSDLKTATFNSQAGIDALQMLVTLKNDGYAAPKYMHNEFFNGQVGMIDMGSWAYDNMFGASKKANFGVAMLPVLKTGVPAYSGLGLYCYGVTADSKAAQAAYNFLQFYCTTPKYQLKYCKENNLIPSLKEAQNDSFYSTAEWQVMIKQLSYSKARPSVPNWSSMETSIADAVTLAVQGQISPKEALDAAAKNVNRLLARN